jgi:hypothetical protein
MEHWITSFEVRNIYLQNLMMLISNQYQIQIKNVTDIILDAYLAKKIMLQPFDFDFINFYITHSKIDSEESFEFVKLFSSVIKDPLSLK